MGSIRSHPPLGGHPTDGGIYVYANGFTPRGEEFLQALVDGLEVRNVRPA